jgi:ethanolamine phosphate transferase 2 subunit G
MPSSLAYTALANLLLPSAVLIFAIGFFPFKPLLPGLATHEDAQDASLWGEEQPAAVFDRVVFMVVDALRSDFVYGHNSGFQFTQRFSCMPGDCWRKDILITGVV